jgi:hypothetical protein
MGKTRREEKLAKRQYEVQLKDAGKPQPLNWKRYFKLLGRTIPRILLLFAGTIAVQLLLAQYKVTFFTSGVGQILLFAPMYVMTFIWTQQVAKELRSEPELPPKPEILKKR